MIVLQAFVKTRDEHAVLYEELLGEAGQLRDKSGLAQQLRDTQEHWNNIAAGSDERTSALENMLTRWKTYTSEEALLQQLVERYAQRLQAQPQQHSTDLQLLDKEVAKYKVRLILLYVRFNGISQNHIN